MSKNNDTAAFVKELEQEFNTSILPISAEEVKVAAKPTDKPADIHPSIMINRVGVYYAYCFKKKPQTMIEKCAFFKALARLPEQEIRGNDVYAAMKKNAAEWYNSMSDGEREELKRLYEALPAEWR